MRRFVTAALFLLLSGCAVGRAPGPTATPTGFSADNLVSTRDYLTADKPLKPVFATGKPRAFVLLDDDDEGRNLKICKAFEDLPTKNMVEDVNPFADVVPTYWLLATTAAPPEGIPDDRCDRLVADFDFNRAAQLAGAFRLPNTSTAYLMAVDGAGKVFYIDIDHGSQEQLDGLMRSWFATAAAESDKPGIELEDWWRRIGKTICGEQFVETALKAALPGWAGRIIGIAFDKGGCKLQAPDETPPAPATLALG